MISDFDAAEAAWEGQEEEVRTGDRRGDTEEEEGEDREAEIGAGAAGGEETAAVGVRTKVGGGENPQVAGIITEAGDPDRDPATEVGGGRTELRTARQDRASITATGGTLIADQGQGRHQGQTPLMAAGGMPEAIRGSLKGAGGVSITEGIIT